MHAIFGVFVRRYCNCLAAPHATRLHPSRATRSWGELPLIDHQLTVLPEQSLRVLDKLLIRSDGVNAKSCLHESVTADFQTRPAGVWAVLTFYSERKCGYGSAEK
jgi:hypothetical protein